MADRFSFSNLFPDFHSSEIDAEELEKIIMEVVEREHPDDEIEDVSYTDDGIEVYMHSGEVIEIEIDWNEIILA